MEELNERMYTTAELKNFAKRYEKATKLTTKNIPGYEDADDGLKSQIDWALKEYNNAIEAFNQFRDKMLKGRVLDAENSKAIRTLQKLRNQYRKIYTKKIKPLMDKALAMKNKKVLERNKLARKKEKEEIERQVAATKNLPPEPWAFERKRLRKYYGSR